MTSQNHRQIEADTVVRDEGTIVVFAGTDLRTQERVEVAVDHRYAQSIVDAMQDPGDMPPVLHVESWQVLRVTPPAPDDPCLADPSHQYHSHDEDEVTIRVEDGEPGTFIVVDGKDEVLYGPAWSRPLAEEAARMLRLGIDPVEVIKVMIAREYQRESESRLRLLAEGID